MATGKKNYIIGIHNSEGESTGMYRVYGTECQVKKHLVGLIKEAIADNEDSFEWADSRIRDIEVGPSYHLSEGALYGCVQFTDYHVDYTAEPEEEPEILS